MTDCVTVLTTTDTAESAAALADSAVQARLAACAQIAGPITSVYWWQDEVRRDQEWQVAFKTTAALYPALEAHLKSEHSYDVPEIIATPVTAGNPAYLAWIAEQTTAPARPTPPR